MAKRPSMLGKMTEALNAIMTPRPKRTGTEILFGELKPEYKRSLDEMRAMQREVTEYRERNSQMMPPRIRGVDPHLARQGKTFEYSSFLPHERVSKLHPEFTIDTDWRLQRLFEDWNEPARYPGQHVFSWKAFFQILHDEYDVDNFDWVGWREQYAGTA